MTRLLEAAEAVMSEMEKEEGFVLPPLLRTHTIEAASTYLTIASKCALLGYPSDEETGLLTWKWLKETP